MHRTHAGHGSIWPAETSGKPAEARASESRWPDYIEIARAAHVRAEAAESHASRAREDALREAIEICKEADAQDDRDNGAAATGAACNAANAILALINKPKGGDRG